MKGRRWRLGRLRPVLLALLVVALPRTAGALRSGWEDPAGGWDFVFEGNMLPDAAGFNHDNDGDAWDQGRDPNAVKVQVVAGQGDTEDGFTSAADATVLLLDDKQTTGANNKFLFTHELRPRGATPSLFEVGVTLIARWRLVSPSTSYNNEYSRGNVGVAEDAGNEPDWGIGAYYASATEMGFVPPQLGGHRTRISSSNSFHTVWMTAVNDPGNTNNLLGNVYLDGAISPVASFSEPGWDTGSRGWMDNVYFALSRAPYIGAMQLDYIGAKVGVHVPRRAGLRAEAGPDQAAYEGETVLLDGTRSREAVTYSWTQIVKPGDPVVQINDADKAIANFLAPSLDQGIVLTFQLTVSKQTQADSDTTKVTVRAANAPVLAPANVEATIGHLSSSLSWDGLVDADVYLLGIASQEPGHDQGPYTWTPVDGTSYHHDNLLEGWTYHYRVKASNGYGEGPESEEFFVTAVPNLAGKSDAHPFARVLPSGQAVAFLNDGKTTEGVFYSNDGVNYAEQDWYGYTWVAALEIDRAVYYSGQTSPRGGWWKTLTVQYSQDGGSTWQEPSFVAFTPDYPFENALAVQPNYRRYELTFPAVLANALRIVGAPGGSSYYTSVAELEVYGPAFDGEVYAYAGQNQTTVEGREVTLDGTESLNAQGYAWRQLILGGEPIVAVSGADSPTAAFTAPLVEDETTLTFELRADGVGGPKCDRVRVRVVDDSPPATPEWILAAPGLRSVYLNWKPAPRAESYSVLRSATPGSPRITVASGLRWNEYLDVEVPIGVHFYTVEAVNPAGSADSEEMPVLSLDFAELGLTSMDIGKPSPGTTTYDPATGVVTVQADGRDIGDSSDSFRLDYMELSGNFELIVEAESLVGPELSGKIGPMVRDNLTPGSVNSYVYSSVMRGLSLQGRTVANSSSHFATGIEAPAFDFPTFLRLRRQGNIFAGSYRRPDSEWHSFSTKSMAIPAMTDPVFAGVAATSRQSGALVTGKYSHFVIVRQPLSPGVGFRKLPISFEEGQPVNVELTVGADPSRRPEILQIVETLPQGTSPIDTQGGEIMGNTITWRFPDSGPQNHVITYSISVSGEASLPLTFKGEVVCGQIREPIPGASVLYRSPSLVSDVRVEMLLAAHLSWTPSSPGEGVVGYRVYRSADGGEWEKVADLLTDATWADVGVTEGISYSYKVTAVTVNGEETSLDLTPPTFSCSVTMERRECEDYNFGGGNSPGGPGADGFAAESSDDLAGTDFFYQKTGVPNAYRPLDIVEIVQGNGASGWSIRNASPGDWFRYTFRNVLEGDTRIVLRAAAAPGPATIKLLWDEVSLGHMRITTPGGPTPWTDFSLSPFPSVSGEHVLRVRILEGSCNLDLIGIGYDWSHDNRRIFFSEDFESYLGPEDMESAGWAVVNGSGDENGAWQLWSRDGQPVGLYDPDLEGLTHQYAISNADLTFAVELDEELISPPVDCRNYTGVRLRFSKNINVFENDPDGDPQLCDVDVRVQDEQTLAWADWVNVFRRDRTQGDDISPEDIDLSSIADGKNVQLRWHFYQAYYDYWFAVDNIVVSGVARTGGLVPIVLAGGSVTLRWEPFGTGKYTVQYADDLTAPNWQDVPGSWPITQTSWSGEVGLSVSKRFYRVVSE